MASITLPYPDFVAGTTIVSQQMDDNNTTITNYINAHDAGSSTWQAVASIGSFSTTLTSNQIVLGTTRTVTLTAPTPASTSRVVTIPDLTGDYSVLGTIGTQTITGAKTFASSTLLLQEAGSTDVITIAVASLASGLIYTLPDAGGAASFVMTAGAQTIGGAKTLSALLITSAGIRGVTGTASATTGNIGEYIEGNATTTNFPSTGTYGDLTSVTLGAGDWDVTANMGATPNGATVTTVIMGISTTSGNASTGLTFGTNAAFVPLPNVTNDSFNSIPSIRFSVSGSTIVYLKYRASFSVATPQAFGRLIARRCANAA